MHSDFFVLGYDKKNLEINVIFPDEPIQQFRIPSRQHSFYSKTSMTRTPMARLPWLIRNRFESLDNSLDSTGKQIRSNFNGSNTFGTMENCSSWVVRANEG